MAQLPWPAILLASVLAFPLGYLWYGPLFGKVWWHETGLSPEKASASSSPAILGLALLFNIVAAAVLAAIIGPSPGLGRAVSVGASVGLGLVATSYAVSYLFAQRSTALLLIDGGYMAARFLLFGLVLGLMV
jgi:Protein of unknown function (DUF1761)